MNAQLKIHEAPDALMTRGGETFAGLHVLIDLYDARRLDDTAYMESVMRECVEVCGATLLHIHLHHFTPNDGVSGVAVLAESHISVHTWPERNFASFDVFMCGQSVPEEAAEILKQRFSANAADISFVRRGRKILAKNP